MCMQIHHSPNTYSVVLSVSPATVQCIDIVVTLVHKSVDEAVVTEHNARHLREELLAACACHVVLVFYEAANTMADSLRQLFAF